MLHKFPDASWLSHHAHSLYLYLMPDQVTMVQSFVHVDTVLLFPYSKHLNTRFWGLCQAILTPNHSGLSVWATERNKGHRALSLSGRGGGSQCERHTVTRLPIRLLTFRGTHEFLRNHVGTDKCAGITHACPWGRMCMAHALSASKLKLVVGILISLRLYYL